jgi:hypothetical protein
MAVVTLWMGIGSSFFTRRFAASCQNVLDQMQRQQAQEAVAPPASAFLPSRMHAPVAAADRGGRLSPQAAPIAANSSERLSIQP